MTRRFIEIVFIVILAGCFSTCRKDETDEMLPPVDRQKEVAAAKQWYESRFGNLMLKSAVAEENGSGKTVLKPEWRTAGVHHNRRLKTVETDLMPTDSALFFVSPENKQKFEETGDDRYLSSLTRLVVQTHRRSGRQIGFLMTIIPSVSYLERTDFDPFKKMAYVGRDKKFSGSILFRHTDGTFSNGWMYSEGKITGSIRDNDRDNEPVISLKGYEVCTTHYIAEFWRRCTYTIYERDDGTWALSNINCSSWDYTGSYTYTICTYHETYEDEFDEGDETGVGGGGGGGGGYHGPPSITANLVGPGEVTLMDGYNLHVHLTNNGTMYSVEFYINGVRVQSGSTATYNLPARKAGRWNIYAKVTQSNGGTPLTSNTLQVMVQYPDVSAIQSNGTVQNAMEAAWTATKNAASSSGRSERGFWIYANTTGTSLTYECGPMISGPNVTGCVGTNASIPMGTASETYSATPTVGGKYAVAVFHTHTPLTYCSDGARKTGPSPADISHVSANMPGILYDYTGSYVNPQVGVGIIAGHDINASAQTYIYGNSRRPSY